MYIIRMHINYVSFGHMESPFNKATSFLVKSPVGCWLRLCAFLPELAGQLHIFVSGFILP